MTRQVRNDVQYCAKFSNSSFFFLNILFPKSQTCLFFKRFWAGLLKVFKGFSLDICWSLTHFQSLYLTNFRRIFVCLFAWWIAQQGVCQPLNHWSIKKHLQNIFLETYLEVDYYWQGLFRIKKTQNSVTAKFKCTWNDLVYILSYGNIIQIEQKRFVQKY